MYKNALNCVASPRTLDFCVLGDFCGFLKVRAFVHKKMTDCFDYRNFCVLHYPLNKIFSSARKNTIDFSRCVKNFVHIAVVCLWLKKLNCIRYAVLARVQ